MSWRNLIWMVIALSLAGLALFLSRRRPLHIPVRDDDPAARDLAVAVRAYKLISQESYPPTTVSRACRGAIEGMAGQVDEFSTYIPPDSEETFRNRVAGNWLDTGLRITTDAGRLMVVGPVPDSPACDAEIFAPMEILAINGIESPYLTLDHARRLLRSPRERPVTLRLRRNSGKEFTRQLTPVRLERRSVTGIVRDEDGRWDCTLDKQAGIFYLRISEFVDRTPAELHELFRRLDRPGGVVLDLRDNPGGTLSIAVETADRFITAGLIVRTVERRNRRSAHYAHSDGTYPPAPMVVLINAKTTSAAEIVAGALQAHRRAVLVGTESYGKWSVQKTFSLGRGLGELHLTTGEYFLAEPSATAPAATQMSETQPSTATQPSQATTRPRPKRPGLKPDVQVRLTVAESERLELLRVRAMVATSPRIRAPARAMRALKLKRSILATDAQLAEALKLLRNLPLPATRPANTTESALKP